MIRIEEAATAEQLDAVRSLFRTFVAWHHATHVEDRRLIARYFDQAAFEAELRDLPGAERWSVCWGGPGKVRPI